MPVSRNRKKKHNQNKRYRPKAASPFDLFNMQLNECRKCEEIKGKFAFDKLLEEEQVHWTKSGIVDQIDYFLYCPSCKEYSVILEMDEI